MASEPPEPPNTLPEDTQPYAPPYVPPEQQFPADYPSDYSPEPPSEPDEEAPSAKEITPPSGVPIPDGATVPNLVLHEPHAVPASQRATVPHSDWEEAPVVQHPTMVHVAPEPQPAPKPRSDPSGPRTMADGCLMMLLRPFGIRRLSPRQRGCALGCFGCLLTMLGMFSVFACVGLVGGIIIANNWSDQLKTKIDEAQQAQQNQTFQTTNIYDRNGVQLHQIFGEGRRTLIKLSDVPQSMIDATIAVEDRTFYDNPGIDTSAIFRSFLKDVGLGYTATGASTITQQLVRNIAFDYQERTSPTLSRKIQEAVMALILTREKSKDEILEMYLNQIYYGNLAYGVEAAARTYFGKSAKDLTLAEASLLAGLPQAPAELDPLNPDPKVQDAVFQRRKTVLDLMVDTGKITSDERDKALAAPLVYADPNVSLKAPHFTLYAEDELKALLPGINLPASYINTAGLSVYTTLDIHYQDMAQTAVQQQIAQIADKNNAHNAAVVILQPGTGEIMAMVGSVDYSNDAIKGRVNITTALKQPGSAIKPLTYSDAMEKGFSPASILWDVPITFGKGQYTYKPVNYDGRFRGPVYLRDALANSLNIPAVQTLAAVGVPSFLEIAQRFGVRSFGTDASKYGLSITLGGADLTPLELAQAYSVFPTGGNFVPVTSILCIINSDNKIIYQYENGCAGKGTSDDKTINAAANPKPVLDPRIAFVISDILADNVARTPEMGSNSPLRTDGMVTSVKTGTTNDFRDNWTVGYTHNLVVGVWVGNTDNTPMINSTGLTGAAPIWHQIITGIYADSSLMNSLKRNGNLADDNLNPPEGMVRRQICNLASLRDPATDCQRGRAEWFFTTAPLAPDANGKLIPQPGIAPSQVPGNGPIITDVEPDIVQTLVQALDPNYAASMVPVSNDPNYPAPPAPLYCLLPNEVKDQVPTATLQLFIRPPLAPEAELFARIYAQANDIPILPQVACTQDMLGRGAPQGVVARITSPHAGDTVTKLVMVSGIVNWSPGQATYFKMEITGPQFPNWTTFGSGDTNGIHQTPVINGPLDSFGAEGLQPGTYKLRIVVVGVDGNYLYTSPEVPVNVTGQ